jgi:hypothetical protein
MNAFRTINSFLRLGLVLVMIAGAGAMAQVKSSLTTEVKAAALTVGNKRYDAGKELARIGKRYSLTADQKAKIQPLLAEQQKQVHQLGEDESLSDSAWAAAVRKVHQQTVLKVKAEMTDEQASKYVKEEEKQAKKSQEDAQDDGPDGPPPDGPPPGGGGPPPGGGGPPGE